MGEERVSRNEKTVLKSAQTIWATNKYFVLACSQRDYQLVRELLKPDTLDLGSVYDVLKRINEDYCTVATENLPEITNALYHMAGYFKTKLTDASRQGLHLLIQEAPKEALMQIENYSEMYKMTYLLHSNIWPSARNKPFNPVFSTEKWAAGEQITWYGDYIILNKV